MLDEKADEIRYAFVDDGLSMFFDEINELMEMADNHLEGTFIILNKSNTKEVIV